MTNSHKPPKIVLSLKRTLKKRKKIRGLPSPEKVLGQKTFYSLRFQQKPSKTEVDLKHLNTQTLL